MDTQNASDPHEKISGDAAGVMEARREKGPPQLKASVKRARKTSLFIKQRHRGFDKKEFKQPWTDRKGKMIHTLKYTIGRLGEHHFFQLLSWNPQAIKTTAILWRGSPRMTLVNLYQMIVEQKNKKSQALQTVCGKMNEALQITLSVQLTEIKTWD